MYRPNLKSVPLPVPEITGVPQKFVQSLIRPSSPFSKIFNGHAFVPMDPVNVYRTNLMSVALPDPENSDWSFGRGLRTSSLGKGLGNGTVRKSVGDFL